MTLNPGDTLYNGQYRILRLLGRGGYGFVYEARETLLAQEVAIEELISGLVGGVADWPYSNYLGWVGEQDGTLVDREFVQAHFATPKDYRAFVGVYVKDHQLPQELAYLKEL